MSSKTIALLKRALVCCIISLIFCVLFIQIDRPSAFADNNGLVDTPDLSTSVAPDPEDEPGQEAEEEEPVDDPDHPAMGTFNGTRIHILSFEYTDAIILESNGKFGIIDSGEDNDYPDGSDPRYPFREGTTIDQGHEDEVLEYLNRIGVTRNNLEFYIGTHPHSDHIGSADEVIYAFHPKRVYICEYKDEYNPYESALWDNLYVYDRMLKAAEDVNAELIQVLDPTAGIDGPDSPIFTLGDMTIEIFNYDEDYKTSPKPDANYYSWGVKVTAFGHTAFLAGDINNMDGDEDELAKLLGRIDILKLGHHGGVNSNTAAYISTISPSVAIWTGRMDHLWSETATALAAANCRLCPTGEMRDRGYGSIITTFNEDYFTVNVFNGEAYYLKNNRSPYMTAYVDGLKEAVSAGWLYSDNNWYYFDGEQPFAVENYWVETENGAYYLKDDATMATGLTEIDGIWYCFGKSGLLQSGWVYCDEAWYLLDTDGIVQTGWHYVDETWYYLDPDTNGTMYTGWIEDIDGKCYFLDGSGAMRTGWALDKGIWYYLDGSGALQTGWFNQSGSWYYLDTAKKGAMQTSWSFINGSWYFFDYSGAMTTGWMYEHGTWYYFAGSGAQRTGWFNENGNWYYLDAKSNGAMRTGWFKDADGDWYCSDASGAMLSGEWISSGGLWYYLSGSGAMATDRWIGDYWVDSNGVMLTDAWVDNDLYYVGPDGLWVPGKER